MEEYMMSTQTALEKDGQTAFNSRFGKVFYSENAILSVPNGLLGMPGQDKFFLAKMPVEKLKNFQVFQSLVEDEISFAVLPHDFLDEGLEAKDISDMKQVLEIKGDELLILLIASVQQTTTGARLSVNLRAPLFVNTITKEAYQIVLPNNKYQVQHFVS